MALVAVFVVVLARGAAEFRLAIDPHRRDLTTGKVAAVHAHFTAAGGLGLSEAHRHDALRLLVPQHDVRHIAERLAFFAHILLEVQEQCGVLIELSERKHFFQNDRASRGTGSSRAALVRVRVPIVDFARCQCIGTYLCMRFMRRWMLFLSASDSGALASDRGVSWNEARSTLMHGPLCTPLAARK